MTRDLPSASDTARLALGVQFTASVPNFLCQEQFTLGEGYLKHPFTLRQGSIDLPTAPGVVYAQSPIHLPSWPVGRSAEEGFGLFPVGSAGSVL